MRAWTKRALLVLASTGAALGGLELWARATWTAPWYQRLLDEQARNQRIAYTENRHGLRDRDYPSPGPEGRLRLLVLGDSFTHGTGVAEDELVWPELVERELDRAPWPGRSAVEGVDVLNGGLSGSLTRAWVRLFEELVDDFQPDAVLVVFFLRDGTKLGSTGYFDDIVEQVVQPDRDSALYQASYLYRVLRDLQVRRGFLGRYRGGFEKAYFGTEEQTRTWGRAQANLLKLRDMARERGLPIGLAVFPILVELETDADYPFQAVVDLLLDFGREHGFPTHDLLPAFRGQDAPELWVSSLDQHPNARGHAIAARSLLPFARELLETARARQAAAQSTR